MPNVKKMPKRGLLAEKENFTYVVVDRSFARHGWHETNTERLVKVVVES